MRPGDLVLAVVAPVIWGLAFVVIKFGLESFSPAQLTVLRYLVAGLPVLVLPRPQISWTLLLLIGLTLFTGQHLLLFFAYVAGMPPGLASVTQQTQAFFTVLLAAVFLREVPTARQSVGMTIAFAGVVLIGLTVGVDLPPLGLALALASACCWGIGNILLKRVGQVQMFALVAWLSLVPPLPALAVSRIRDGDASLITGLAEASWWSIAAAVYLGALGTTVAYAIWARLLARYPVAVVTPFAFIAPCTGVIASALIFGEVFGPERYAGMALLLVGLAVIVLPVRGTSSAGSRMAATGKEPYTVTQYTGVIIEESLADTAVLKQVRIISTRTEEVTPGHRTPWVSQWTLHTIQIPEAHVEEVARDISEALDPERAHAWYADFKNDDRHVVIFHNKTFLIDRRSDAQYEDARQYGLSLGIPAYQLDFKPDPQQWER